MTDSRTPRPHRPEPIGWGTVEPLAGRAQTIAKGWLLLLLERAPLDAVGAIPAAALAAEGPALCNAVVRALGSDVELDRLRPDGDLAALAGRIGPLAGAGPGDAAATVAAVDALRACIWAAALDTPASADAATVRALADRLGEVTAVVTGTAVATAVPAVAAAPPAAAQAAGPPAPHAAPPPATAGLPPAAAPPAPPPAAAPAAGPPAPAASPPPAAAPPPAAPPPAAPPPAAPPPAAPPPAAPPPREDEPLPHGEEPANGGPAPFAEPAYGEPAPEVHDLRAGQPDAADSPNGSVTQLPQRPDADLRHGAAGAMDDGDLWIATLERHIDRCQREGGGLALLRVELVDADRVAASAPEGQAGVPYGRLAQAVRRAIRRQDLVASDHQGRAWVIAPGVGRAGAIALAERIGAGVEHGETWRGAPLAATIGFAVYGEDGRDGPTLIDRAEEAMLAATAAGVRIGEAIPQSDDDGQSGPRLVR
ncbi:GGDEF domain-containing protein [Conexibacter woesei]|uniref:Putative diguanylate cyclase n=1 Tax=Conexibacter woesei (strain DSM 14684 / CCUG 47730 / CIP 108061 / JCM 11494 / NBRC 100937 / ID131577) TaxID=469383 RepID=D3FA03_CONWI|nr:diguanylate cyclase [Conexibacter woesei]ADB53098.1 putative diguanylate cyclase [Conexibacter woesei DSM 14684]